MIQYILGATVAATTNNRALLSIGEGIKHLITMAMIPVCYILRRGTGKLGMEKNGMSGCDPFESPLAKTAVRPTTIIIKTT